MTLLFRENGSLSAPCDRLIGEMAFARVSLGSGDCGVAGASPSFDTWEMRGTPRALLAVRPRMWGDKVPGPGQAG